MKKIKLGKLTVAQYVADKPIGVRGNGDLIYASDILSKKMAPSFGLPLASTKNKVKLALARLKAEPDFELGIFNKVGRYSKKEILNHVQNETSLGLQIADIEAKYSEYFTHQLIGTAPSLAIPRISPIKPASKAKIIPNEWKWVPPAKKNFFKTKVVFCENTTDAVTTPAANYRIANVHPVFRNRGFEVVVLRDAGDIRTNFIIEAKKSNVVYLGGIGHGSYNLYTGHFFNHILEVGTYDNSEVSGKVIHYLSCETGRDLGPNTITKGAKAYAGYTENFVFDWGNANLYWPCDSQFDISMANGKSVEQAVADTYAKFDVAINSVPGTNTAALLLNDKNLLRTPVSGNAWGSRTAQISPYAFFHISPSAFFS